MDDDDVSSESKRIETRNRGRKETEMIAQSSTARRAGRRRRRRRRRREPISTAAASSLSKIRNNKRPSHLTFCLSAELLLVGSGEDEAEDDDEGATSAGNVASGQGE